MKKVKLEDTEYELIENNKEGFSEVEVLNRYTDYFGDYDYILGDWSYGKLRLKGFCDKKNKIFNTINDFEKVQNYIKEHCAYGCKYFILKKINK